MATIEKGLTRQEIIRELTRSPHGALEQYVPVGARAAREDPEFFAHLIAWNAQRGQIRDAKVALPVLALGAPAVAPEIDENALAHLALLSPRDLVRAIRFAKSAKTPGRGLAIRRLVERYLRVREERPIFWERSALQHRDSMRALYALFHVKPAPAANRILFGGERPAGSVWDVLSRLKDMSPTEAAGMILQKRIPFLVAVGALGARAKDPDVVMALIGRMSPAELVNNSKALERLGVKTNPALRAAYAEGVAKVAASKKVATLKTTRAAEALGDSKMAEQLRGAQEKQLDAIAVKGSWLVLGDKSSSMKVAIESARIVAATLARLVEGEVRLVFFDTSPRPVNVTGKDYDAILRETKLVNAGGATSIGVGLDWALKAGFEADGIAIVSDGAENTSPMFAETLARYREKIGKDVPVYLYQVPCDSPSAYGNDPRALAAGMARAGMALDVFDLTGGVDYYSLPNLAATMRANRYSLADEIMETPLLTLAEVFKDAREREAA